MSKIQRPNPLQLAAIAQPGTLARRRLDADIDAGVRRLRNSGVRIGANAKPGVPRQAAPLNFDDRVKMLNRRGKAPRAAVAKLRSVGRRTTSK